MALSWSCPGPPASAVAPSRAVVTALASPLAAIARRTQSSCSSSSNLTAGAPSATSFCFSTARSVSFALNPATASSYSARVK